MKLPLLVRKKIYTLLLTVPAIICVRQNRTAFKHFPLPWSNFADVRLLPGLAYVTTQTISQGLKLHFDKFPYTNVAIMRTSSKVYGETKEIFFGRNTFDLLNLTKETSPPVDFRVPAFSRGCQRVIKSLCIRGSAPYTFRWVLTGGHAEIKNAYRGLKLLTLVLEVDDLRRGIGKKLVRGPKENWVEYVKRIVALIARDIFDCEGIMKKIPTWINLRVVFEGDHFADSIMLNNSSSSGKTKETQSTMHANMDEDDIKKEDVRRGVLEAFHVFQNGRC
ncbi:hypothetical protein K505DRAFT_352097 [Melanomma pulvis-pyrius CBS 109.77]|uniref:Uncharacterized protein n=1 Tax=Melanomma pulvis-pyrius CBS 109.77 TaxID=1314802 RepID=A0A6A6X157_9PLEO|nr:hypothetical protein K505DRAFT_352097 [Melanomma pulvis-pyrius CBS 109.77]